MFQIGGLIVFCGLLALPLPVDLSPSPMDLGKLTGAVSNGLLSNGLLDSVKNLPLLNVLKTDGDNSEGLIGKLLQQTINPLESLTGIEITKPKLLEIGIHPSDDGYSLFLNVPLSFDLKLNVPIVRLRLLRLSVKLNATVEVLPQKNESGVHLVLNNCLQAPVNLEVSLLDGTQTFFSQGLNSLTNTLSNVISKLVLSEVCSSVNQLLSQLDVSVVQNIIKQVFPEMAITTNI